MGDILSVEALALIVHQRKKADPAVSYTRKLLDRGLGHCAKKFGEEAVELVVAALEGSPNQVIGEAADAIYNMLVVLEKRGVPFALVGEELMNRHLQMVANVKAARRGT